MYTVFFVRFKLVIKTAVTLSCLVAYYKKFNGPIMGHWTIIYHYRFIEYH